MELHPDYLKICYQLRLFYREEEVMSTGDDYVYTQEEAENRKRILKEQLGNDWDIIIIRWTGTEVK